MYSGFMDWSADLQNVKQELKGAKGQAIMKWVYNLSRQAIQSGNIENEDPQKL